MAALAQRNRQPELMDDPELDRDVLARALRDLGRINWISRSSAIVWPKIRDWARGMDRPLNVLDVASGGGDVAMSISQKAMKHGLAVKVTGCDISEASIDCSRQLAKQRGLDVEFFQADILADSLPSEFDVIMCSLFLHHMDEEDAKTVLEKMSGAAARAILVSDLVRSRLGYTMAVVATRLFSRSKIIHTDGPLSVQGAFRPEEVAELAESVGLKGTTITRHWPQRFLLCWERPI